MDDVILRPWQQEDRPELIRLWQTAFGDGQDYIQAFLDRLPAQGGCIVAQAEGRPVSAMYILDGPLLFPPEGSSLSTAYTYALATDPAWRGRGIGTAVYRACVKAALERVDAACVLPSEPSLYAFYEKAADSRPVSFVREAWISREEIGPAVEGRAMPITPGEYYLRRKALLRGQPYTVMPPAFFSWQLYQMQRFGGGFVSVDGDIAAVEMDGDACRVLELLDPEGNWMDLLRALAARFPAERYLVRTPVFLPGPGQSRPFLLAVLRPGMTCPIPDRLWWGFAFD